MRQGFSLFNFVLIFIGLIIFSGIYKYWSLVARKNVLNTRVLETEDIILNLNEKKIYLEKQNNLNAVKIQNIEMKNEDLNVILKRKDTEINEIKSKYDEKKKEVQQQISQNLELKENFLKMKKNNQEEISEEALKEEINQWKEKFIRSQNNLNKVKIENEQMKDLLNRKNNELQDLKFNLEEKINILKQTQLKKDETKKSSSNVQSINADESNKGLIENKLEPSRDSPQPSSINQASLNKLMKNKMVGNDINLLIAALNEKLKGPSNINLEKRGDAANEDISFTKKKNKREIISEEDVVKELSTETSRKSEQEFTDDISEKFKESIQTQKPNKNLNNE